MRLAIDPTTNLSLVLAARLPIDRTGVMMISANKAVSAAPFPNKDRTFAGYAGAIHKVVCEIGRQDTVCRASGKRNDASDEFLARYRFRIESWLELSA